MIFIHRHTVICQTLYIIYIYNFYHTYIYFWWYVQTCWFSQIQTLQRPDLTRPLPEETWIHLSAFSAGAGNMMKYAWISWILLMFRVLFLTKFQFFTHHDRQVLDECCWGTLLGESFAEAQASAVCLACLHKHELYCAAADFAIVDGAEILNEIWNVYETIDGNW